ncbi:MAG: uracil-DNA glycosylase [Chloroflexi bacterium]|nr:uracil-DNA glycosylase [Chloroflexota bacterium]|tara:strand:- start:4317 stop:4994 length:678 start_codon:yes stop_codon:yes gene_type:complete
MKKAVQIDESWLNFLDSEFSKEYMNNIKKSLINFKESGKTIYPKNNEIFNAINFTKFERTKVIIIGQDPYHGPGQAHGFSFSVKKGIKPPPSLLNIFKEIESDLSIDVDKSNGDLTRWANQGVLLLNSILTVEKGNPLSHKNIGWENLTDKIIDVLCQNRKGLVFVLWGAHARSKKNIIEGNGNLILESAHPSPLSAHRGFLGSKPFSKINKFLIKNNIEPINWS